MHNQQYQNPRWVLYKWCTENNWFWWSGMMKDGTTLREVIAEVNRRTREAQGAYRWTFAEVDGDAEVADECDS